MNFEEVYTNFSSRIFRVCMGYVNDPEQARDLTQETFILVWQNLSKFRNESKISTWIFRIATNVCLRAIEKSNRVRTVDLPHDLPNKVSETAKREHSKKLRVLYDSIGELEETDKLIISLVLEELPQKEIAEIVGLSEGNIRVKVHRIKQKLADNVKKHGRLE
ncbi:MAG: sigma-70 family RNA polymerase sigma factor [Pyrinomonadaceae bacterium]